MDGGGVVCASESAQGNRTSTATFQTRGDQPVADQPDPERSLDLRDLDRRARMPPSEQDAGDRSPAPPATPGWRFDAEGTAIWFWDGHRRTGKIVLPTNLDDMPERGFRRALRAMGGLRPSRWQDMANLDEIRQLTIQLVVMTEYRELLYAAAVSDFERPVLVERGVRLVQSTKDAPGVPHDLSVMDEGSLRVELDRFTFAGSRYTRSAAARHISSVREDVDGGQVHVQPSGGRLWHLDGVSPVGVFAAATACRMTAEDSRRYRSNPAKVAAELLGLQDPPLPMPGGALIMRLAWLCESARTVRGLRVRTQRT